MLGRLCKSRPFFWYLLMNKPGASRRRVALSFCTRYAERRRDRRRARARARLLVLYDAPRPETPETSARSAPPETPPERCAEINSASSNAESAQPALHRIQLGKGG